MRISDWSSDVCSSDLLVTREGIDVNPLLVRQQHFELRRIEGQRALLVVLHVLDERVLPVQPRLLHDADRSAELQDQRLLRLAHREGGAEQKQGEDQDEAAEDSQTYLHRKIGRASCRESVSQNM